MGANLNLDTLDTSVRANKSKQVSNVNEENTESTSLTSIMERLNSAAGAEQNKSDTPEQEEMIALVRSKINQMSLTKSRET